LFVVGVPLRFGILGYPENNLYVVILSEAKDLKILHFVSE